MIGFVKQKKIIIKSNRNTSQWLTLYIYIYIYIYILDLYICIHIHIYVLIWMYIICYHENNVPSWLSHSVGALCVSWITYDHIYYALVEHSLVHWCQQRVTIHHVPKCMSCHKVIVVITVRAHCFHDNIYIMLIMFL